MRVLPHAQGGNKSLENIRISVIREQTLKWRTQLDRICGMGNVIDIAVIPGDGIGPEVVAEAVKISELCHQWWQE